MEPLQLATAQHPPQFCWCASLQSQACAPLVSPPLARHTCTTQFSRYHGGRCQCEWRRRLHSPPRNSPLLPLSHALSPVPRPQNSMGTKWQRRPRTLPHLCPPPRHLCRAISIRRHRTLRLCHPFQGRGGDHGPPPPCVTLRRVAVSSWGPGQSPVLPFACFVGSLCSGGRCGLFLVLLFPRWQSPVVGFC